MFSDGYTDQIGGRENKKFSRKRLFELMANNKNISMQEQLQLLELTLEKWAGNSMQIDDILVAGFRFGNVISSKKLLGDVH